MAIKSPYAFLASTVQCIGMAAAYLQLRNKFLIRIYPSNVKPARTALDVLLPLFFLIVGSAQELQGAIILSSSFSLSEQYDDNLFFSKQDRQSDFTTVLSPSFGVALTSKHATLSITYTGSAQFNAEHSEADGYFQSLSFDIDLPILNRQIKGLEVKVTENISYSPELPAFSSGSQETETDTDENFDRVLLAGEGVQTGRVDTFRNFAGVTLNYPWSRNFTTSASYFNVITRFSEGDIEDSEVNNGAAEANYRYKISARTEWTNSYGVSATFGVGYKLFHAINTEIAHELTRLISVNGGVSVSFIEGESPQAGMNAGISKRYKTGDLNLQYRSDLITGLGVIRGLTRRQSVVGSATSVLGRRISSSAQLAYASNRSFDNNEVNVATYTAGAGISMRFLSWLKGSFSYSYLRQQSEGSLGEDGERNTISFTLTGVGSAWRIIK